PDGPVPDGGVAPDAPKVADGPSPDAGAKADSPLPVDMAVTPDTAPPMPDAAPPMPDLAPPMPDMALPMPDAAPPMPDMAVMNNDAAPDTAPAMLSWNPINQVFDNTQVGDTSPAKDLTLSNDGQQPSGALNIQTTGDF